MTGRQWPRVQSTDSRPRRSTGWVSVSPVAMNGVRRSGDGYAAPDRFNCTIERAMVETRGPVLRGPMAEIEAILAEQ